jgi:hypothetical protein
MSWLGVYGPWLGVQQLWIMDFGTSGNENGSEPQHMLFELNFAPTGRRLIDPFDLTNLAIHPCNLNLFAPSNLLVERNNTIYNVTLLIHSLLFWCVRVYMAIIAYKIRFDSPSGELLVPLESFECAHLHL